MDRRAFMVALFAAYGCGQKDEQKNAAEAPKSAPLAVAGQSAQRTEKLPRVALVFNNIPVAEMADYRLARAFGDGLRALGWVEGQNVMIERRSAEGRYERLPILMQELLALHVNVIVAVGPALGAATRSTDTIPIST